MLKNSQKKTQKKSLFEGFLWGGVRGNPPIETLQNVQKNTFFEEISDIFSKIEDLSGRL